MQNLYPLFEKNRILKKELLWSLRDYSFTHIQLEYQDYSPGIICGCDVRVDGNKLVISPGIVKYENFICLITEEEKVEYEPTGKVTSLKLRIITDHSSQDSITYEMNPVLDETLCCEENEFELCRFKLQKGAVLRERYTSFEDMMTEYDTMNPVFASWSGLGSETITPVITKYFAEQVVKSDGADAIDLAFAWTCLNTYGAVSNAVILSYLRSKGVGSEEKDSTKDQIFMGFVKILKIIEGKKNTKSAGSTKRHRIIVD